MTATNTYGRQVVIPLTNKSGGGVIAGDVVVVDTSNNDAFTTDTSGGFTGGVGVAQETIANNATGRVLIGGYAALINVNASVTRGQYGKTHTVAKQATGSASRTTGTFCQFLTGGTTPDALVFPVDLAGTAMTNPMTTAADLIVGGSSGVPARLAKGSDGQVLTVDPSTHLLVWATPSGGSTTAVGVKATTTAATAMSNGVERTIPFEAESFDTDGFHDNSTNNTRLTVPSGKAGLYLCSAQLTINVSSRDNQYLFFRVNGSGYENYEGRNGSSGSGPAGHNGSVPLVLAVGDYVELGAMIGDNVNLLTTAGFNWFSMVRIGT